MQLIRPACLAANRVASNRLADKPVCGKCGAALLPMQPFALTGATFDHYVDGGDAPVLVDFWAEWCPPCRFMNPILGDLAQRRADIRVAKLDVTTEGQLPLRFKVRAIPSLILSRPGTEIARFSGAMAAEQLSARVDDALRCAPMGTLVMRIVVVATLLFASAAAQGGEITVTDTWHAAMAHDPIFAAAQAQRDAGRARGSEGRALWLPTLSATGGVARSDVDSRTQGAFFSAPGFGSTNGVDFQTSVNGGTATRWALIAEQPLFDTARLADSTAQKNSARIAEAQYRGAEQDLMVRSAHVYFDVLNARAQLQTLQRLHSSAEKTRAEAQARYEAGDIPVTDMREAQASADAIGVQELDVRSAVTLSEAAFSDLTGLDAANLGVLPEAATADMPPPDPLASWTQRAISGSPLLAIQHLALTTATAQVNRYDALTSPRVSLVAQLGRDSLHGNGDFGAADITGRQASIGIQATIPLFTGGMRSAQRHEARALEHQAEAELDGADQQVRQRTRTAWLSLTTAAARVQALQHLRASAASRLDATRLGAEIGGRTALELLSAEADYQRSGADFQRAQSDWFLAGLQLKAEAGELSAADLEQIDHRLGSSQPEAK